MDTIKMLRTIAASMVLVLTSLNQVQAQWEFEIVAEGGNGNAWAVADFDGDGDGDLTYNNLQFQETLWFENSPGGWLSHYLAGAGEFNEARVSGGFSWDLDQDGDQDFVYLQFTQPSLVIWYENILNERPSWLKHVISDNVGFLTNMAANIADLDGDGDFDMAIIDNGNGMAVWFENTGDALNWTKHDIAQVPPNQGRWVTVMDADGDTDADIVVTTNDSVFYLENQLPQTSWTKTTMGAALSGSIFGRGADVDNDGDLDLVTHGLQSGQVAWYDNPSWDLRIIADNMSLPIVGAVSDLDNDGDVDVVTAESRDMAWFENTDNGMEWQRWTIVAFAGAVQNTFPLGGADQYGPMDLNQDGTIDIAATVFNFSTSQGDLRWYANPNTATAVEENDGVKVPSDFHLTQNFPNPFWSEATARSTRDLSTVIQYEIPKPVHVKLTIYNVLGEKIRTLVDSNEPVGIKQVTWDGRNERGQRVSSGVYLYRLEVGEFTMTRRLVVMR